MQPTIMAWTILVEDQGLFLWSLVNIQWVVSEEKLFKEIVDARTDGRTLCSGKLIKRQWTHDNFCLRQLPTNLN